MKSLYVLVLILASCGTNNKITKPVAVEVRVPDKNESLVRSNCLLVAMNQTVQVEEGAVLNVDVMECYFLVGELELSRVELINGDEVIVMKDLKVWPKDGSVPNELQVKEN